MKQNENVSNSLLCKQIHQFAVGKTEFQEIQERYSNLSDFLSDYLQSSVLKDHFKNTDRTLIEIIVIGGFALKNATKQIKDEGQKKFNDLDLKVVFSHLFINVPPETLVTVVRSGLELYAKRYGLKVEGNERCTHIHYKDITVDISAAVRTAPNSQTIKIPIYNLSSKSYYYKVSRPEAFIELFNETAERERKTFSEVNLRNDAGVDVEDLEFQDGFLGSVQYASMLMKSHKNKFFDSDEESKKAVKSILLSALCLNNFTDSFGVMAVIDNSLSYLDLVVRDPRQQVHVGDKSDPSENYARYLNNDPKRRELFISWLNNFKLAWDTIKSARNTIELAEAFKTVFDEDTIKYNLNRVGKRFNTMVNENKLHIAAGGILSSKTTSATTPLTRNSNWGSVTFFEESNSILRFNELSLTEQVQSMKRFFPQFTLVHVPGDFVEWHGSLQSPLSKQIRKVVIRFHKEWLFPRVFIEGVDSKAPHIHISLGNCLCLFKPKYSTWNYSMHVSKTILPWTIGWIVQWEIWKVTGKFNGNEEKH